MEYSDNTKMGVNCIWPGIESLRDYEIVTTFMGLMEGMVGLSFSNVEPLHYENDPQIVGVRFDMKKGESA